MATPLSVLGEAGDGDERDAVVCLSLLIHRHMRQRESAPAGFAEWWTNDVPTPCCTNRAWFRRDGQPAMTRWDGWYQILILALISCGWLRVALHPTRQS